MKKKSLSKDGLSRMSKRQGKLIGKKRRQTTYRSLKRAASMIQWKENTSSSKQLILKNQRVDTMIPGIPMGMGTRRDPISIPLRVIPNSSNCHHCPIGIEVCTCQEIDEVISRALHGVYTTTSFRRQHAYGRHPLNSKSVLPVFVTRISRLLNLQSKGVFWDLGCGIGNVVIQAALQHGVDAVGIDIQAENIEIAEKTWNLAKAEWVARYPDKRVGCAHFFKGDMFTELAAIEEEKSSCVPPHLYPNKIWMSNQLFTPHMNHQLADLMTRLKSIQVVCCMHDIFPHERLATTRKRNPKPYEKFPVMKDYMTQRNALEWSSTEERLFYIYSPASH